MLAVNIPLPGLQDKKNRKGNAFKLICISYFTIFFVLSFSESVNVDD